MWLHTTKIHKHFQHHPSSQKRTLGSSARRLWVAPFSCIALFVLSESKFLKIDTCRNEHLFSPSVSYANEADEYSDGPGFRGTGPQACLQLVERITRTCGTGGKTKNQSLNQHASLSSALLWHMLKGNYNSTNSSSPQTFFSDVFFCFLALNLLFNEAFLYAVLSLLIHFASF